MNHVIVNTGSQQKHITSPDSASHRTPSSLDQSASNQDHQLSRGNNADTSLQTQLDWIDQHLSQGHYDQVVQHINEHYSAFSSAALSHIQSRFYAHGILLERRGAFDEAVRLYSAAATLFDDLQTWLQLSRLTIRQQRWQQAFKATLRASLLQNDSAALETLQSDLITIASNYRNSLEKSGNQLDVHTIYDELYKAHPGHPRFQLELAYSYIRLDQYDQARALLAPLQYDTILGELSQSILSKLNAQHSPPPDTDNHSVGAVSSNSGLSNNRVVVPLSRLGSNLLVEARINQHNASLLLDTGASITALDTTLINRLNLPATGSTIQISTANGVRTAQLYRAENINLGRFRFKNQVVAGIELGANPRFLGLLGTDLLNSVGREYAYVIDNRQGALIFNPINEQQ